MHSYVAILRIPTELTLIWAYLGYGYGRPRQQLRAYYCYGYRRSTATGTGVLRLWLRAYYDYSYRRTTTTATGVLRLRLRANVQAYYVDFFTAYTVLRKYVGTCPFCTSYIYDNSADATNEGRSSSVSGYSRVFEGSVFLYS